MYIRFTYIAQDRLLVERAWKLDASFSSDASMAPDAYLTTWSQLTSAMLEESSSKGMHLKKFMTTK